MATDNTPIERDHEVGTTIHFNGIEALVRDDLHRSHGVSSTHICRLCCFAHKAHGGCSAISCGNVVFVENTPEGRAAYMTFRLEHS